MRTYKRKVFYYETDQMGIVHHSNYIRWFEEARIDFLTQIGLTMEEIERNGIQIPVLSVSCEYRKMTHFAEEFEVQIKIEKYNGVKLQISYVVKNSVTGEITNTGSSSHCFIDMKGNVVSLKKVKPEMHEILLGYLGTSTS